MIFNSFEYDSACTPGRHLSATSSSPDATLGASSDAQPTYLPSQMAQVATRPSFLSQTPNAGPQACSIKRPTRPDRPPEYNQQPSLRSQMAWPTVIRNNIIWC
jgi:hypothetical protein